MADMFVLLSVVVPDDLAVRLDDVCRHRRQSRAAAIRDAVELFVDGYLDGAG